MSGVVQFIDVRDLARFTVLAIEDERAGIYAVTGRRNRTTMGDVVAGNLAGAPGDAIVTWADGAWLEMHGLEGRDDRGHPRVARGSTRHVGA